MESNVAQLPLSHRAWAWFEKNKKPAVYGAVILAVVGVVVWFAIWKQGETRRAAGEALSSVTVAESGPGPHPNSAQAYLKVASSYSGSSAGARALLLAAGSLFDEGKYPEAQVQFDKFTREYQSSPFMGEALLGKAACLDAQGKTDAAVAAYKDLIDHHPGEPFLPQAKFALARLYEAQKKLELARDLYQDVVQSDRFGSIGDEASMRLKDLLDQNPELKPATPATTASLPAQVTPPPSQKK